MDTETKTGIDTAKATFKKLVQKAAEATGDLTGNKIADKITSACKTKSKEDLRLFQIQYKNRTSKNVNPTRYNI